MTSNANAQRELDNRIRTLELELCSLKHRRNALSPIAQLPPEVLCKIFIASIPELDYKEQDGRVRPHAMVLSHVSHQWRATIMDFPEPWGYLRVGVQTKAKILNFAFDRARYVPIYLNLCGFRRKGLSIPSDGTISALSTIVREGSARWRALDLYVHGENLHSILDGQKSIFGHLTSLKLHLVGTGPYHDGLTEFLQCSFPRLRQLELSNKTRIPFGCNLLQSSHLTHVEIEEIEGTDTTVQNLFDIFKRSTGLQQFIIHSISDGPTASTSQSQISRGETSIALDRLEKLVLPLGRSFGPKIINILSYISIPTKSSLTLSCTSDAVDTTHLMVAVQNAYRHLAPVALHLENLYINAWNDSPPDLTKKYLVSADDRCIHVTRWGSATLSHRILKWGWSFASLRVLRLGILSGIEPGAATELWAFLAETALETIYIGTQCVSQVPIREFLASFRTTTGRTSTVPWASLQALTSPIPAYNGTDCYRRMRQDINTPPLPSQYEYALDLVDALKAREQAGVKPLKVLALSYCFDRPVDEHISRVLLSGAEKVTWS